MDVRELERALGRVVLESAYLERVLRAAFSALVGSKYAAVIDSHFTVFDLIEGCQQIAAVHTGIADPERAALATSLSACQTANHERNRAIHDAWDYRPGARVVTLQSQRKSQDVDVTARTLDDLQALADRIGAAASSLTNAVERAFGAGSMGVDDELRRELGRDIQSDLG
jgi:hypothetical protein